MATDKSKIIYTLTDEAPLLATASFLPIIRTFTAPADIEVAESDISVAARVLGEFSDFLPAEQRAPNNLAELGKLTLNPSANIIKLPTISAAVGPVETAIVSVTIVHENLLLKNILYSYLFVKATGMAKKCSL